MLTAATETLNVNAFEHLMFADDRGEAPMTFFLRLALAGGKLDHDRFRDAVAKAIARHPLLQSTIVGSPHQTSRALRWLKNVQLVMPFMEFAKLGTPPTYATTGGSLDITKEIGVRLFVREGEDKTQVTGQFHHSAVDAKGGAKFLEDVLAWYHALSTGEDASAFLTPIDPARLDVRTTFGLTRKELWSRLAIDLYRIGLYFRFRPEVLAKTHKNKKAHDNVPFPADQKFDLDAVEVKNLKAYAKKYGVSVNDVLVRDLFHTLDDWNSTRLRKRGGKSVRVAIAINMRRGEDEAISAANVVSMVFLDRTPKQMQNSEGLLASIGAETKWIKDNYLGMALIRASRGFTRIRSGFKMITAPNPIYPCHSTAVLSNLGQMFAKTSLPTENGSPVVGGLKVEKLELLPPFRPNTPFAIGVATVGDTMALTMNYNAKVMSDSDARELIANFATRVRSNAAFAEAAAAEPSKTLMIPLRPVAKSGRLWGLAIGKNVRPKAPNEPTMPTLPAQNH